MKIVGAYHIAQFPGWEQIVFPQIHRIRSSGLLDKTEQIFIGVVGDQPFPSDSVSVLLRGKALIARHGPVNLCEFPTLGMLKNYADTNEFNAWYIHTKGVSNFNYGSQQHRLCMESVVIDNHRACSGLLDRFDVCGSGWSTHGFGEARPHFSGNFWWARSDYLAKLPTIASIDNKNRYEAEFWIGKNPGIKQFNLPFPENPFNRPSAWVGLENKYKELLCGLRVNRIVELGVDYGFSLFTFASDFPLAAITGIDTFGLHPDAESWVMGHLGLFPNITILNEKTAGTALRFETTIDLLHIDADHEYESVRADLENWLPHVRSGGIVLFHDTCSFPGVRKLFDSLPGEKREIKEHHGLGAWVKP